MKSSFQKRDKRHSQKNMGLQFQYRFLDWRLSGFGKEALHIQ